jgi:hypothetical protein
MRPFSAFLVAAALLSTPALAQYNATAGVNAPVEKRAEAYRDDKTGELKTRTVVTTPAKDGFGNAKGNQYDLAVDGAFDGQTVAVLHFYTGEGFDFEKPKAALKEKGFSVFRWINAPPTPEKLEEGLKKADQLWIISGGDRRLTDAHIAVIKKFFEAGHGVYIWGDNEPYYADANAVGDALLGVKMLGNVPGGQTVGRREGDVKTGLIPGHLLTTGLENLFEGITIATIQPNHVLTPLVYGSAGNFVTGFYDKEGKRLIFDGGFTRLYCNWDTAGTGRYVKNAAAWLANVERFGKDVSKLAGASK